MKFSEPIFLHFQSDDILYRHLHLLKFIFPYIPGGAVAIDLATREEYAGKIWCLVLENTFTSIPDMAKVLLGWRILQYFPMFFYKNKVNSSVNGNNYLKSTPLDYLLSVKLYMSYGPKLSLCKR